MDKAALLLFTVQIFFSLVTLLQVRVAKIRIKLTNSSLAYQT